MTRLTTPLTPRATAPMAAPVVVPAPPALDGTDRLAPDAPVPARPTRPQILSLATL